MSSGKKSSTTFSSSRSSGRSGKDDRSGGGDGGDRVTITIKDDKNDNRDDEKTESRKDKMESRKGKTESSSSPKDKSEDKTESKDSKEEEEEEEEEEPENHPIEDLLVYLFKIVELADSNVLVKGEVNPVLADLKRYKRYFEVSLGKEEHIAKHMGLFNEVYKRYKKKILANDESWLIDGKITIGIPADPDKKTGAEPKIRLSVIYNQACTMKDEREESLDKMKASTTEYAKYQELNYPDAIILCLYKIFAKFAKLKREVNQISEVIKDLENALGLNKKNSSDGTSPGGQSSTLISGIMGIVSGMGGGPPPDASSLPSDQQLTQIIGGIFNNDKLKETLSGVVNMVKKSGSFEEIARDLGKTMEKTDPGLSSAIASTLPATAKTAIPDDIRKAVETLPVSPKSETLSSSSSSSPPPPSSFVPLSPPPSSK